MTSINQKINRAMTNRGYYKNTAYLLSDSWEGCQRVYICRGVAMDCRRDFSQTPEKTTVWAEKGHVFQNYEKIYAIMTADSIRETYISDWCADPSVFVGIEGGLISTHINTETIDPVTLPVVAGVYETRKMGKFSVDLNIAPQRTGNNNSIGVYPDKSWADVRPGYALIEKITYKAENFAFVSGHMLDETSRVSLSHFERTRWCGGFATWAAIL